MTDFMRYCKSSSQTRVLYDNTAFCGVAYSILFSKSQSVTGGIR